MCLAGVPDRIDPKGTLMRGSVQKKGNRWYAVVYDGVNPATGKYRRRWVSAGTRRGDAEKLLAELVNRSHRGETVVSEKVTLGDYLCTRWLPVQRARLRTSTFESYRRSIELHVIPALGGRPLDKLTVEDIDVFYAGLLLNGDKRRRPDDGGEPRGLAPKSVHNIHVMLNKALGDAARKGTVIRNVVALADAPSLTAAKRNDLRAWEADHLALFLENIGSHRLGPMFHLVAHTGMRRGEVLGLRWGDIDLGAQRLSVRQAMVSVGYEVSISDVKTGTGRRSIDLDAGTVAVLRCWFELRTGERGGTEPLRDDLVVAKADGQRVHPDVFSQVFDRRVARLGVPAISLHDLRHTHATLLIKAGVPVKVVSERLGHANVAFTMNVYQHVLPGMQADAAEAFARIIAETRTVAGMSDDNGPEG